MTRARLIVDIDFDDTSDPRDLIPVTRLWLGEGLEGRRGVLGWRITGTTEPTEEPAR
ncbi:hypothetical protein ACFZAR_36210 [Streptomyces sp. NPDC008222]|uniref:hypothetical protein n=1 Tax=Streptomyces sp. NPDC008222 TaxID=3364820 RepID=UPI0036DFBE74